MLPSARGLSLAEAQRIARDLDTQEQIDAFLADWEPPDDDPVLPAILTAVSDDDGLLNAAIALTVSGTILLAVATTGGRYNILRLTVPEGWADLPGWERRSRTTAAIAGAERATIGPDALAEYRNTLDAHYRTVTRGLGDALADGGISLDEYHRRMVEAITEAHTVQRKLGQGTLSPDAEDELMATIDEQLGYLDRMVQQIEDEELSPAQITDRSGRYGANGGLSFNLGMAAALDAIAVTEQRFLGNCTPHCPECLDYAARGRVTAGTLPSPRMLCRCGPNCCCRLEFYDLLGNAVGWIG